VNVFLAENFKDLFGSIVNIGLPTERVVRIKEVLTANVVLTVKDMSKIMNICLQIEIW